MPQMKATCGPVPIDAKSLLLALSCLAMHRDRCQTFTADVAIFPADFTSLSLLVYAWFCLFVDNGCSKWAGVNGSKPIMEKWICRSEVMRCHVSSLVRYRLVQSGQYDMSHVLISICTVGHLKVQAILNSLTPTPGRLQQILRQSRLIHIDWSVTLSRQRQITATAVS